jgi:hypothetical protein
VAETAKPDVNDPELIAQVLSRLACGETTRAITQSYGATFEKAFWKRMVADENFSASIARAREVGQDTLTAETIDIADAATEENVNSAKLRIWTRQWYASRMSPKKYGDKTQTELSGEVGVRTINVHRGTKPCPK